uniref:L1 transposable element RRM domain-containing protein n=1 Tax=Papio anubis TaxID=9555 RepID=A0A2I3N542_PAPAN
MNMERNQHIKDENYKNQNSSSPPKDHNSSPAREQNWTKNEFDKLTEVGFRRWIITNSSELREHILTQCKKVMNLEKRLDELSTVITSLEKNINDLMELKNAARELHEPYTSINSRIDQAEKRISETEDQHNEIKGEDKIREKRMERNKQSLQEIRDYVERPNLHLMSVLESDGEKDTKLENSLQGILQGNFHNLARQANTQIQEIHRTPQRYSSRRATPRHINVRFTKVEMKEKMLRAAREERWVTHKRMPIRLRVDLSAETLQARTVEANIQHYYIKEKNFQPRISYPAKLSFISKEKIKSFTDKQRLRDFITTMAALQEPLKEALNMERKNWY